MYMYIALCVNFYIYTFYISICNVVELYIYEPVHVHVHVYTCTMYINVRCTLMHVCTFALFVIIFTLVFFAFPGFFLIS